MRAGRVMAEGGNNKRIDLAAPLRSGRLPYHKADLKSGPVSHPGAVPFVWEQSPGRPKSVRTRRPPPTSSSPPRSSEYGGGASPYHDALGERDRAAPYGVATAAVASRNGTAGRWAEAEAKKESVAELLRREEEEEDAGDDDERFSDALDTLSRTESFTVNCSVSGLSGMPDRPAGAAAGAEAGARGFMMDRFLPAAQAVAVGSPQYTFRKAGAAGATSNSGRDHARAASANCRTGSDDDHARRAPVRLPYQHLPPNYLSCNYPRREELGQEEEEDDDDYDVHSTRGFASKGCGLLPGLCAKSSLFLLNPVPMMKRGKVRGRGRGRGVPSKGRSQNAPSPLARSSQNNHPGCDSNRQSWEEVYKHKLEHKYIHQGEDRRSKLTSESNHLTFWSDSQTGDGSSPFHHSIGGDTSPYCKDIVLSPSHKADESFRMEDKDDKMSRSNGSSSLGKDHDHSSLVGSDHSSLKGSSSMSSGPDRRVHEDSETTHLALLLDTKLSLNSRYDSQLGGRQIVGNTIVEGQDVDPSTERITQVPEPALLMSSGNSESVKLDDRKTSTSDTSQHVQLHSTDNNVVKKQNMPLQYLLPLPVPKSPSESWLSRNLPSAKNKPPMPSFLGMQVQPKKQAPWDSMHPKENDLKPSRPRQIRFADVVERPNYLDSEI
ncbi:uncharacterized protein LOC100822855 [Brachypodium distachyon]|uniref:Uncharacterized protein n=1 Tax=Brachypodium distachyon TaxID=15368 RepID=I1HRS4_BRADI|nr:uncharacterized protein LOC100822855 [Brachypodium distachyon]KQK09830.1 hypothetical protein BRADI_2g50410v3 [Brachypodium distachyon]|eukprot:XP_003569855.1 uncharacterized protein LOC100822855 [Brachypodium distachyon]